MHVSKLGTITKFMHVLELLLPSLSTHLVTIYKQKSNLL